MSKRGVKRARKAETSTSYYATHVFTFPVATCLLLGSRERAVGVFQRRDVDSMNKIMASFPQMHRIRHVQFHNINLIGRPPAPDPKGPAPHPWGSLTFGIIQQKGAATKQCIVSCIHHRATKSPEDALLEHAHDLPWKEIPECNF